MSRLAGKVAVITGGAGVIGKAAANLFVQEGAKVLLVDLDEAGLKEIVQSIGTNEVSYSVADVTQPEQVQQYVKTAVERYGGIDVFLDNAGVEGVVAPIVEYPIEVFDQVLAVNVRGAWLGLKYVIPAMAARGGGSIIITSSVAGVRGGPAVSAYATSKHAVVGMMRSAASECGPLNIRVNTVNPSPVESRMMGSLEAGFDKMMQSLDPDGAVPAKTTLLQRFPVGRYAEPHEVAQLMLFLASDESKFITGSTYMVDGGFTTS